MASDIFDVIDWFRARKNANAYGEAAKDLASATGPEDLDFIRKTQNVYGMNDPNTIRTFNQDIGGMLEKYKKDSDSGNYAQFQDVLSRIGKPSEIPAERNYKYSITAPGERFSSSEGPLSADTLNSLLPYGKNPSMKATLPAVQGSAPNLRDQLSDIRSAVAAYKIPDTAADRAVDDFRQLSTAEKTPYSEWAYKIGHIEPYQEGRDIKYREFAGMDKNGVSQWRPRPDLGGGPKDNPSPSNIFIGTDSQGNALFAPTKGTPTIKAAGVKNGPILPKTAEPLPPMVQENLSGGLGTLRTLNKITELIPETNSKIPVWSFVSGLAKEAGVAVGVSGPSADYQAYKNQFRLDAQSMIKGTPSNFDVQTVVATLPTLRDSAQVAQTKARVAVEKVTQEIQKQIAYYKGTNKIIPQGILDLAESYNVDTNTISADPNPWKNKIKGGLPPDLVKAAQAELARRSGGR